MEKNRGQISTHFNNDLKCLACICNSLWVFIMIAMPCHAQSLQSYPTLCDLMDCSLPGFSVHGIFQARILDLVFYFDY